jgi:hypothetical protein
MTVFTTHCYKKTPPDWRSPEPRWLLQIRQAIRQAIRLCLIGLLVVALPVRAGSIEPRSATLSVGDDSYRLAAEFSIDLGARLEEIVSRGVPLYFNLEFELTAKRWYWFREHVAGQVVVHRLSYNALTRQYRLATGGLHQDFSALGDALRVLSRVGSLPVVDRAALKPGETYQAELRLMLDRSQLPKPFQVDAIANKDWQVDAKAITWPFVAPERHGGEVK